MPERENTPNTPVSIAPPEVQSDNQDATSAIRTYSVREKHLWAALSDPQSPAAEQFRTVKARIDYLGRLSGKPVQKVVVTSPSPGDGKTLTSLNLGLVLSQDGSRDVLLIECDLRRPAVRDLFDDRPRAGLIGVLNNEVKLSAALVRPEGSRLLILPAGGHTDHPAEVLSSLKMKRLLEILRRRFDHIILDTPPVVPFVDADELAAECDGVLIVVRAGQTARKAVGKAVDVLSKHSVIGILLNDVQPTPIDRYYDQYGYDYDYRTHKERDR